MAIPVQLSLGDLESDERHEAFLDKFRTHVTTDDCLTPPEIYDVVADYVAARYAIARERFVRPFWPGRDYTREDYPEGCVVVDNPPFSILGKILDTYLDHGIDFFLFGPTMTIASSRGSRMRCNHIVCHASVTYANGAKVPTSFITNLDRDGTVLESCPELSDAIEAKDEELRKAGKAKLPKYVYPDHVIHAAKAQWFAAHGVPYRLNARDCMPISKLDAMGGKAIFGGGLPAFRARSSRARSSSRVAAVGAGVGAREGARLRPRPNRDGVSRPVPFQKGE